MPERTTERTSDELLLKQAGKGDDESFLELYRRYRNPIFRFAYRMSGSIEVAEDVTHDCFLNLIRRPENFNPGLGSLQTYLYAAARNLSLKQFRHRTREAAMADLEVEPSGPAREEPLGQLLEEEMAAKVRAAIAALPELQREVLVLYEYEGLALNEIAGIVGAGVGAVKARLFRARQRLKADLKSYLNSGPEIVTLERAWR